MTVDESARPGEVNGEGAVSTPETPLDESSRLAEMMDVLVAIAAKDFSKRATVGDGAHLLDGIAAGLNMLAEETEKQARLELEYRRRMAHTERLAAVGQLAASVAHEINNPAAYVLANLSSLSEQLESLEVHGRLSDSELADARDMLNDSLSGVQRIVAIVKDLRGFSRAEQLVVEPLVVHEVCEDAYRLVSNEIYHCAEFVRSFESTPVILGNRVQLTQVITNLLLNAAHAIVPGCPEKNRIELMIRVETDRIAIRVRDTGVGMSAEVQSRIFEPFFTTKPGDRGTGLGLSVSSDIVYRHRGEISVDSVPGVGTTFVVYLPFDTGLTASKVEPRVLSTETTRYKIMIIDDEEDLLVAYKRLLGRRYDLTMVSSGRDAIDLLERDPIWDAVLCDIMMPELDGFDVYEWVRARHPALIERVGFCTGGVFTPRSRELAERVASRLYEKPLTRDQLISAVETLCRGGSQG